MFWVLGRSVLVKLEAMSCINISRSTAPEARIG